MKLKKWLFSPRTHLLALFLALLLYIPVKSGILSAAEENKIAFPIIMYHNISEKPRLLGKFAITPQEFESDLLYLKNNGYETITMEELLDAVYLDAPLPEKPVILTFDDGYESFYTYVYPLLKKYDMCAVMSVVGSLTDLFTAEEDHNIDYSHLNWEQLNEMSKSGLVEIQNHTYDCHKNGNGRKGCAKKRGESLSDYSAFLREDLEKLQQEILSYTGKSATTFTYPFGSISPEALTTIQDLGFHAALTCTERPNIFQAGDSWLYALGRYNRPHGKDSAVFFQKIERAAEKLLEKRTQKAEEKQA